MDGECVLTVSLMQTSARQQVLTLFLCLDLSINHVFLVFPRRQGRTEVSQVCGEGLGTAYLTESASGQEKSFDWP